MKPRNGKFVWLVVFLGLVLWGHVPAWGGGHVTISGLRAMTEAGATVIKVTLSKRHPPKIFSLDSKGPNPRVVVDFAPARGQGLPGKLTPKSSLVRSIRVGAHPDKVRLVIDLAPPSNHTVEQYFVRDSSSYILRISRGR